MGLFYPTKLRKTRKKGKITLEADFIKYRQGDNNYEHKGHI
jgi:hypothetical protein